MPSQQVAADRITSNDSSSCKRGGPHAYHHIKQVSGRAQRQTAVQTRPDTFIFTGWGRNWNGGQTFDLEVGTGDKLSTSKLEWGTNFRPRKDEQ
ncbi:unnamed protein product [Cercopithifilaria johnstoni]|uniref:Uncharacterized protein n=1 Tax=Cercopithifilaria johnstoni TaxID=2874296 RepID=A0A8J2M7J0_9BILA|nr:unnamed protein product [Cercopithifilaria johnstoni]